MTSFRGRMRGMSVAAGLAIAAVGLSGCGGVDGVELNGKIFDAVGLSGDVFGKKPEPKTEARSPLVLPPDANRLPEPGSAPSPAVANQSWPVDREANKVAEAENKKKAQDAYCKDGNWKEKAMKDETAAAAGPSGSCSGSLFSLLAKQLQGE